MILGMAGGARAVRTDRPVPAPQVRVLAGACFVAVHSLRALAVMRPASSDPHSPSTSGKWMLRSAYERDHRFANLSISCCWRASRIAGVHSDVPLT